MRGWITASISLELSIYWRPIRIRRLPATRTSLGRQCMQECAMRISCKSSSPWDRAILPRHEADDAASCAVASRQAAIVRIIERHPRSAFALLAHDHNRTARYSAAHCETERWSLRNEPG